MTDQLHNFARYRGRMIKDLTRDELIAALEQMNKAYIQRHEQHQKDLDMMLGAEPLGMPGKTLRKVLFPVRLVAVVAFAAGFATAVFCGMLFIK